MAHDRMRNAVESFASCLLTTSPFLVIPEPFSARDFIVKVQGVLVYHYITFWIIGHWFVVILSNMNCTPILFRRGEQDHGGNGHLQHPAARRDQGGDHGRTPPLTLLGSKVIVMWQLGI